MSYAYLYKLIIIGDTAVGKSCILLQYMDSRFKPQHDITIGVEYGTKIVSCRGKDIRLQIWDTAGSETFKSITRTYYKGVAGALLVFDLTRADTFENVAVWLDEIRENASSKISLVLVGNKADMPDKRQVTTEEAQAFAEENGMAYVETSAKTGENVQEAFEKITDIIYQKVENGVIDVTQESSGVRLGTEVKIEQLKGVQQKFALNNSARGGCSSC